MPLRSLSWTKAPSVIYAARHGCQRSSGFWPWYIHTLHTAVTRRSLAVRVIGGEKQAPTFSDIIVITN